MAQRKIPSVMFTQHPDNGAKPYWHSNPFIPVSEEVKECFLSFSEMGAQEFKWDWEGKFVDESVLERLYSDHFDFFKKRPLGKDFFLTFRLPNPKVESEFRFGRALMGIFMGESLAENLQLSSPPLFEVILPMIESSSEMIEIQEAYQELKSLRHPYFRPTYNHRALEIIPIFEQVSTLWRVGELLKEYFTAHKKRFGTLPSYFRPYCARSDPALNSGLVPTVLAVKGALASYKQLEEKFEIPLYPILGTGSLPFRGHLTPSTIPEFLTEYPGVKTAVIQSAFRYDYPLLGVKKGLHDLSHHLKTSTPLPMTSKERENLKLVSRIFEKYYRKTIENLAPFINDLATSLPRRRERMLHVGLFGYNRGVGKVHLPRAIAFTGALYSIGIPPELIGTGRGLHQIKLLHLVPLLDKWYPTLRFNLLSAGKYLNKKNLKKLSSKSGSWGEILQDISYIEEYLGEELEPNTPEEKEHQGLTGQVLKAFLAHTDFRELMTRAAILRRSLG